VTCALWSDDLASEGRLVSQLSWSLFGSEAMRGLDRHTIDTLGVPGEVLMESAGRAVTAEVLAVLPGGGSVVVVCGSGNNGGDGFVVARHLHALGVPVRIALLGDSKRLRGDAAANWKRARAAGVPAEGVRWRAPAAGVIVDAIFGTGLSRAVAGAAAASIRRINAARETRGDSLGVVAIDVPSGSCADTGQVLGAAVHADSTVTIQAPKLGLSLEPGRSLAGRVSVARIGIAEEAPGVRADAALWTRAGAGGQLPLRPAAGHKGSFGHALIVAGSEGKTGAAALAAVAATRSGAGLVTVACPAGLNDILEIKCTEAMTAPVADTSERSLATAAAGELLELAAARDVVALGPGIGRSAETTKLVEGLVPRLRQPLVIDADGLFAFAGEPERLATRKAPTVLTPHPGEAAGLLGVTAAKLNADRVGAARELAQRSGAVVLLKGAASVTAAPDGRVVVNPTGGPALGSGGTGDVLTGVVAGLVAQGMQAFEAAALAAFVHGAAADRLAASGGSSGLLAGDLASALPEEFAALRAEAAAASGDPGGERLLDLFFPEP
jgi:NAD(P)H-hydrate epimerase